MKTMFHPTRLSSLVLIPALAGAAGVPALASTTVSTATTTPLATPSAGDVTVASGGSIAVSGQPAIIVASDNAVTVASGATLATGTVSNGGGILVNAGTNSVVSNAGVITASESYTVDTITGTSAAAGPIANTTGRYGILVTGPASGSLSNSGTISVKGLNSAGIGVTGLYSGTITNTGTIAVKGDGSVGLGVQSVTGDLAVGGTITVAGSGTQAVVASGDIGGGVALSGVFAQATSYTTDASTTQLLTAAALKQDKALVEIAGNVAKGIVLYAPCTATTVNSVVSCTSTGTTTSAAYLTAYGNNPALQIGGASNTVIGAGAASINGSTYSLAIDGTVGATAGYSATDAFGVVIGGRGGTVALPGGIGVTGAISATAIDATATAVLINPGSTVSQLTNGGSIKATLSQTGGTGAYAVRDLSGSLTSVVNSGTISATAGIASVALDLSANTSGVTYTQALTAYQQAQQKVEQAAATYDADTALVYTSTLGDILTGSGNDTIAIQSGTVTGTAVLGGGSDRVALSGDARWTGTLRFGSGRADITLGDTARFTGALSLSGQPALLTIGGSAVFSGTAISGGSALSVAVNGGSFGAASATTLAINDLTVNAGGTLQAYIDGSAGTSSLIQANTASFATGAKVSATVSSLAKAPGSYRILTAGALSGTPTFTDSTTVLPLLFKGAVAAEGNDLVLTIARKSASELGLTSSQGAGYDAIYANATNYSALANSLLEVDGQTALATQFDALLPDHAGGVFDFVTRGSRLATRHVTDDSSLYKISEVGAWLEPAYFRGSKTATGTAGWTSSAFGLTGGWEKGTAIGMLGVTGAWFGGTIHNGAAQAVKTNSYELGAFWRISKGPFYAFARTSLGRVTAASTRTFTGTSSGSALSYTAASSWSGWWASGSGGASYKFALPGNFTLKPMATVDFVGLRENAHTETGSAAILLNVGRRRSSALTARTTLTAGWSFGASSHDGRPFTIELEGGRRNQLAGRMGVTTANYTDGASFAITPDALKSGWLGEARILQGGFDYTWQLAAAAEKTLGGTDLSLRAGLSVAF
ncbi:autotransporter domain-containing protein [Novosphingobium piscinae]|uniref:Autotransporter domain-containing protein n=1 Tax=Novosphingobium piscinae TaxID=1507448 RepID=A0A7X1KNN9_9SPHN|nr:autotransporter domain-containing protein [Novosphingobium piscinae]MBC2667827.1 autotransporter domain-containing protein [Novosphingobium piscinae]